MKRTAVNIFALLSLVFSLSAFFAVSCGLLGGGTYEDVEDPKTEDSDGTGTTQYTVNFETNGGSSIAPKTVTSGALLEKPADPIKVDYKFVGWYKDNNTFASVWSFTTNKVTKNMTLYARWSDGSEPPLTVTFRGNGGNTPTPQSIQVRNGEPYGTLATVTRAGRTFEGWFTGETGGSKVTDETIVTVTADQTLYAHWNEAEKGAFDLTSASGTGSGWSYSQLRLLIKGSCEVTLTGTTTSVRVVVESGSSPTLILKDVNMDLQDSYNTVALNTNAGALTLKLEGENIIKSGSSKPGINVSSVSSLRIYGTGSLEVFAGDGAPGIGSNEAAGEIAIDGGTLTVHGGLNRAGIGSTGAYAGGKITITGGTVRSTGGYGGAGIGGGLSNPGGTITITGGTVTAVGGYGGAGIGGGQGQTGYINGYEGAPGAVITITGGTVTATGGDGAAGIGGGISGTGGTIVISSPSTGTATGSAKAIGPGIGGSGGTFNGSTFPALSTYTW